MDTVISAHKLIGRTLEVLEAVAEQADEAIVVLDPAGTVRFANHAWAMIHGYDNTAELLGKRIDIFHTDHDLRADVFPFLEETKRRGQLTGTIRHVRQDGSTFSAETKMVAVRNEQAETIGLVFFAVDVTRQNQVEQELKQQCDRLSRQATQLRCELTAAGHKLRHETDERRRAEEKLRQYRDRLQHDIDQLSAELITGDRQQDQNPPAQDLSDKALLESIAHARS